MARPNCNTFDPSVFSKIGNPAWALSPSSRLTLIPICSSLCYLFRLIIWNLDLIYLLAPMKLHHHLGMENIKIPSPSTILNSPDTGPAAAPGKYASPQRRAKRSNTAKPKQTKSRNGMILKSTLAVFAAFAAPCRLTNRICLLHIGCITCKAKRLKCDERKPSCDQCKRRKVTCGGYKKDFKWRPFEETNLSVGRPTSTKPKRSMFCFAIDCGKDLTSVSSLSTSKIV